MSGITGHGSMTTGPTSNHVAAIRNTETLTTKWQEPQMNWQNHPKTMNLSKSTGLQFKPIQAKDAIRSHN